MKKRATYPYQFITLLRGRIEAVMHIAVCDDSMIERKIIMNALYEYASMHSVHFDITEYDSGMNLLYDVQDGQDYNLVFLDIIMGEDLRNRRCAQDQGSKQQKQHCIFDRFPRFCSQQL